MTRSISSFGGDWHLTIISNLPLTISLRYPYSQPSQYLPSQFFYLFVKNKNELFSHFTAGTHSKSHTLALATTQNCYTSEPWYPTPSPPVLPSLFCSPYGDAWSFQATILDVTTVSQPLVFVYVAWVLYDHPNPSLTSTSSSPYSFFFHAAFGVIPSLALIFPKPEKLHMAKENHPVVPTHDTTKACLWVLAQLNKSFIHSCSVTWATLPDLAPPQISSSAHVHTPNLNG